MTIGGLLPSRFVDEGLDDYPRERLVTIIKQAIRYGSQIRDLTYSGNVQDALRIRKAWIVYQDQFRHDNLQWLAQRAYHYALYR